MKERDNGNGGGVWIGERGKTSGACSLLLIHSLHGVGEGQLTVGMARGL